MLVVLNPQKAKFYHRCFHPLAGQSFLWADTAGWLQPEHLFFPFFHEKGRAPEVLPPRPSRSRLRLAPRAACWQGLLLTVTHHGGRN